MRTIPDAQTGSHNGGAAPEACGPDALARRKDELEMVLGAAGIGACRVNMELAITACDSQFKALFGLAPDAQPHWSDVEKTLASEDRDTLQPAIEAALEHEELLDVAVRTTWSELGPRWVFLRGRVLHDARGQRIGMLLVARASKPKPPIAPRTNSCPSSRTSCAHPSMRFSAGIASSRSSAAPMTKCRRSRRASSRARKHSSRW